ncbi:MAG TPA: alpha/beta hydrolase, partial [Streptosporangiaceae bacterium]|nr:alpha/beta hydrolase [Streptosporangiaceae bacterium]
LILLEPPAFPLLGVSIPPRPAQVIKLLIRHPRAGLGFIKFGAKGIGPAIKAFERGDDAGALRVFMAANTSDAAVERIPEAVFQRFVDNAGPLKAQLKAGFPPFAAAEARAIRMPALLVSGADSPAHLKAVTDRLAKLLPDAHRLTIAGATHNMFSSHSAEFNAGVLRFIRSHSAAGR